MYAGVANHRSGQQSISTTPIVGFWAGENARAPDGHEKPSDPGTYYEPGFCGHLIPEVWRVLQDGHVPLYLNVQYGRDFGQVTSGAKTDELSLFPCSPGSCCPMKTANNIPIYSLEAMVAKSGASGIKVAVEAAQ